MRGKTTKITTITIPYYKSEVGWYGCKLPYSKELHRFNTEAEMKRSINGLFKAYNKTILSTYKPVFKKTTRSTVYPK